MADVSIRNIHGVLRAALTQVVRWGWITRNVASLAELSSRKVATRGVMSASEIRAVIAAGDAIGSEVGLMLRIAAVTGLRAELAALQWSDVVDGVLTIDSAIEIDRRKGKVALADAPTKTANQRRLTLDAATLVAVERERAPWVRRPYARLLCVCALHCTADHRTGIQPETLRFRSVHCVYTAVESSVPRDVWRASLDERLIDYETGVDLEGYVWGVKWHLE